MSDRSQQTLGEGFERTEIPEITEAAEEYRAYRDERMKLAEKENAAQANLVAKMQAHNQSVYRYEDNTNTSRKVVLAEVVKAKVAKVKDSDADEN